MPTSSERRPAFPFTAVVGQPLLKQALLLSAVDPHLGGVLISGPLGVAKSTLARGLAALLPEDDARLVTLPLTADESQLVGSLDLNQALQQQQATFRPGLLAQAHGGILYIDEVNLLADHLVDALLDVASLGINHVERDGISHSHPAEFVLIGTMNPEEGELRPQLSDRFGLSVMLDAQPTVEERIAIVRARRRFDTDPKAFIAQQAQATHALRLQVIAARALLPRVVLPDALEHDIATRCVEACVEGVRADLAWQRAARAHAALDERETVLQKDIDAVAPLVLAHRGGMPSPPSGNGPSEPPPSGGRSGARDGAASSTGTSYSSSGDQGAQAQHENTTPLPTASAPRMPAAQRSARARPRQLNTANVRASRQHAPAPRHHSAQGVRSAVQHRAAVASSAARIDWPATVAHRDNRPRLTRWLHHDSVPRHLMLDIILLDASASTRTHHAFAQAQALAEQLTLQTRRARGRVALQVFNGHRTLWLASGQRLTPALLKALQQIAPSGGTPLSQALETASQHIQRLQAQKPYAAAHTWLLTDARTQDEPPAAPWPTPLTVVDTEQGRLKLHRARRLATLLGGHYTVLNDYWMPEQTPSRARPTLHTLRSPR